VGPGRLVGRGRVLHRRGDVAFLEATLTDAAGATVATATATIRVIPLGAPTT
jgi:acyl-coenzyme A thioesterase PaaI-like protein